MTTWGFVTATTAGGGIVAGVLAQLTGGVSAAAVVAGVVGGLAVGLLLAGAPARRVRHFRSVEDVEATLAVPVLAAVPEMFTARDHRRRTRRRRVQRLRALAAFAVSAAVIAWVVLT
jgi:hypothetical protein